jgi:hypothetical protein
MSKTLEALAYYRAKDRCNNPRNGSYPDWGGRGIKFRFTSFEEFFAEVGPKPRPKHLYSLDRWPDNDGHYEKGNVRWAKDGEQLANRRIKRIEDFSDEEIQAEAKRRFSEAG